MSGESDALKGGDDLNLNKGDKHAHEGHDPLAEFRAGAQQSDRVAKTSDNNIENLNASLSPEQGFADSTAKFAAGLANASPEVKSIIAADAKDTADFYGKAVEKEFGPAAGQLATNFNMNLMTGKSVDSVPQEAASLKA